ncbi:MAG: spore photoproduct lyase, partial [Bacillota bacterium]
MNNINIKNIIIRENALDYPLGKKLNKTFNNLPGTKVHIVSKRGKFPFNYDLDFIKKFHRAKKTIVVSVRTLNKFQSCKPSAHYQLPLISGCPGHCEYCYLSTNLGKNPYIRIYVNLNEILAKAKDYIEKRKPKETIFEGSATSDPLPVEQWTNSLAKSIKFFSKEENASFRFVSKFTNVDSLLNIKHNSKTEFRFSLNSNYVIKKFERGIPKANERIKAAYKVKKAGYKVGFLIAPIFIYENWKIDYLNLLKEIKTQFKNNGKEIFFELISHRFTKSAKEIIKKAYPKTELPMDENLREFKYGQFGYGKYLYPKETLQKMEDFFEKSIQDILPESKIKY